MGGGTEVLLSQCHPICLEVNGLELLWIEIEDITWPRGDTNFIFEC